MPYGAPLKPPGGMNVSAPAVPTPTLSSGNDMSQFRLIDKDGVQSAWSMHVRFVYDEMTFRATMRVNGASMWKTALTPYKGTKKLSPFVTLAARA
jgi:hypothetical protein